MSEEVKQVKWDDVKDKMIGLIPLTNAKAWEFTPKIYDDIPEEFRPVFKLKMFTIESSDKIRKILADNMLEKKKKTSDQDDKIIIDEVYKHFVGWKNLYDLGTGELIIYDGSREMFDILPKNIITKIFQESLVLGGIIPRELADIS